MLTVADSSNPWWTLLEEAVKKANGKLSKPEIFPASTDARFFRELGLPAFGFSPMANTPVLLHDHNEVCALFSVCLFCTREVEFDISELRIFTSTQHSS